MTRCEIGDRVRSLIDIPLTGIIKGATGTVYAIAPSSVVGYIIYVQMDRDLDGGMTAFTANNLENIGAGALPESYHSGVCNPKCDCGATAVGSDRHAHYCTLEQGVGPLMT